MNASSDPASPKSPAPRWAWWVATGFGSGRLRPAPGTWGSLAALLAWLLLTGLFATPFVTWAMRHTGLPRLFLGYGAMEIATPFSGLTLGGAGGPRLALGYWAFEAFFLLLPVLMTWAAVRASDRVAQEVGHKDPSFIVADEWAGMWIALWPLRWQLAMDLPRVLAGTGGTLLLMLLAPFLLFRLFDIWKPWPAREIQTLPGGQGIVADDVVAGLYALALTQLLLPLLRQLQ